MINIQTSTIVILLLIGVFAITASILFGITILFYILFGLLLFNEAFREAYSLKGYLTHPLNFLSLKFKRTVEFPWSKDMLSEKLTEIMNASDFKSVDIIEDTGNIFAVSRTTWKSSGENIYIDFIEEGDKIIVHYCSVNVFNTYATAKAEKNYRLLLDSFEESLII